MDTEQIVKTVLDSAFCVHTALGPGLLENVYHCCLVDELRSRGLDVQSEVAVPVVYKDKKIPLAYRADIVVCGKVLIEMKAVAGFSEIHTAQIINYMRLGNFEAGLLLNFNVSHLKQGVRRFFRKQKNVVAET